MIHVEIIANPIAGTKRTQRKAKIFIESLEKHFQTKTTYTEYAGHAFILAKQAVAQHTDTLVAIGGDGTVNEVTQALVNSKTSLFIIPIGSGNGLARDLNMYGLSIQQIIKKIELNQTYRIDSGNVNGNNFFCTFGVGFDAFIGHLFAKNKVRGFYTYVRLCLQAFCSYKSLEYTICTQGNRLIYKAFLINIANNKQFGNHAYIAPKADLTDGLFTVTIIKPFKWYHIPYMAYSLFLRKMPTNKFVISFNCGDCELSIPEHSYLHIDGNPININSNRLSLKMQAGSVKTILCV